MYRRGNRGRQLFPRVANPDAFAKGLVRPRFNMPIVLAATVKIFADIPLRTNPEEPYDQPEGIAVFVVDYDGQKAPKLVTGELAPQPGDPIHYVTFCSYLRSLRATIWGAMIESN